MIINFYIPENDSKLIELIKGLSSQKRRSFSFVIREAIEYYLLNVSHFKKEDLFQTKKEEKNVRL